MDVLLRVKASEIKVDDLIFHRGDLNDSWRVTAIVDSSDHIVYAWTKFAVNDGTKDKFFQLYESRRVVVSREMMVMKSDGTLV